MQERASGILLHPSCFPSRGGIGDFGPAAYDFVDFLTEAKQSLWQILPLAPVGYGNSPYSGLSAFAGNPFLISLDRLAERGWISPDKVASLPDGVNPVDFEDVRAKKFPLLQEAARTFLKKADPEAKERYEKFSWLNGWWLEDFVLFAVLRRRFKGVSWNEWPKGIASREPNALDEVRKELGDEVDVSRVIQFFFFEQWRALHEECRSRGIRVVGDIAIFVSYDSSDVWAHPELFRLKEDLSPEVVAGVPPDYFSKTGQRWGNPLYRWDELAARRYEWWIRRMQFALQTCDIVRIDHFRGFESYWEIPAEEETAIRGQWVKGPGEHFFQVLREDLGELPLIAEDLGMITDEVVALRERLGIPGMKVLQFGFNDAGAHIHLPHRVVENTVIYTGTHDNDTSVGWYESSSETARKAAQAYFGCPQDGMHWAMVRAAETSVARQCIIPLQDLLGLDSNSRMNIPSHPEGNWTWRYQPEVLTTDLAHKLAEITEVTDRVPSGFGEKSNREVGENFAA
ncbi:MAG TPA: 4-alpha-glucanotransferase [Terriglobales bacterium]|nr:4-alpha-glucanotransferase [Terriglobales bacterium]